jgi:hypothetical protein
LALSPKIEKAILDAGFNTLGALRTHMNDQGLWWPKSIKGLGDKGQDAVCDAFMAFWAAHPEYCETSETAA